MRNNLKFLFFNASINLTFFNIESLIDRIAEEESLYQKMEEKYKNKEFNTSFIGNIYNLITQLN